MCGMVAPARDTDAYVDVGNQSTRGGGFGLPGVVPVFIERGKAVVDPPHQLRGIGNI